MLIGVEKVTTSYQELTGTDLYEINQQIKLRWDANVITRALDLEQETDQSYINVIKPWVIERVMCYTNEKSSILDIGCGCGYLTNSIYEHNRHNITGIDISEKSVLYAKKKYPNTQFWCKDICKMSTEKTYDLCLAVMLLNNIPNIRIFFSIINKLIRNSGKAIVVIPHPCFWPQHHLDNNIYYYTNEISYDVPFATKGRADYPNPILYFHRKIETYLLYAQMAGLEIIKFNELPESSNKLEPDILSMEFKSIDIN